MYFGKLYILYTMNWIYIITLWITVAMQISGEPEGCNRVKRGPLRSKWKTKGEVLTLKCKKGFNLVGEFELRCNNNQWSHPIPRCVREGCPSPILTANLLFGLKHGEGVAEFSCAAGHRLVGETRLYCNGRRWSSPQPFCTDIEPGKDFCDFEHDTCGWAQSKDEALDWMFHYGMASNDHNGPLFDHTLGLEGKGRYLLMKASPPAQAGDTAVLTWAAAGDQYSGGCLVLWYFLTGSSLSVSLEEDGAAPGEVWSVRGDQGSQWLLQTIQLPDYTQRLKIHITAKLEGLPFFSDVAIDDVTIDSAPCEGIDIQQTDSPPIITQHVDYDTTDKIDITEYTSVKHVSTWPHSATSGSPLNVQETTMSLKDIETTEHVTTADATVNEYLVPTIDHARVLTTDHQKNRYTLSTFMTTARAFDIDLTSISSQQERLTVDSSDYNGELTTALPVDIYQTSPETFYLNGENISTKSQEGTTVTDQSTLSTSSSDGETSYATDSAIPEATTETRLPSTLEHKYYIKNNTEPNTVSYDTTIATFPQNTILNTPEIPQNSPAVLNATTGTLISPTAISGNSSLLQTEDEGESAAAQDIDRSELMLVTGLLISSAIVSVGIGVLLWVLVSHRQRRREYTSEELQAISYSVKEPDT